MTSKAQEHKQPKKKKDKLDFTEIKKFCFLKNTTEKVKK